MQVYADVASIEVYKTLGLWVEIIWEPPKVPDLKMKES